MKGKRILVALVLFLLLKTGKGWFIMSVEAR